MGQFLEQSLPPAPRYTEDHVEDLQGKVILVTGAASGVGFELACMLYEKGAKVYAAARSAEKAQTAIHEIESRYPEGNGQLVAFAVDLSDLDSVRAAAERFLAQESRLNILVNNAGIMQPPRGSKSKQGYDLEMGTNVLGPLLLTNLLLPLLQDTANSAPKGSVRCIWVSSMIAFGTVKGGIVFENPAGGPKVLCNGMENYMQSKVGNLFMAKEFAKRDRSGILHVAVHPGLIRTNLQRHQSIAVGWLMGKVLKPARYGAYSELFASLSPEVTLEDHNGCFVVPWGRFGPIPKHIESSLRSNGEQDGTGIATRFWDWANGEVAKY